MSIWLPPYLSSPCFLQSVTQGPAPRMFRLLQNMFGTALGCSSPGVTPPDHSWGLVAAPAASPGLGAHTGRWRWSCCWQPLCARPCPVGGTGILEKWFIFTFFFPSEGIQCYSVESCVQVEFLGSGAVVCLHLKIWPLTWKQAWASFSSFIQAVLSQGQGAGPAQLNHCSQLLNVSK